MADTITGSRTLTAMFDTSAEAERAVASLRAAGIPDDQVRVTQGTAGYDESTYAQTQKGFFESLGDFFFPDEDRYAYSEGLARGAQIVTVSNYDESYRDTIIDILDDEGSVDLDSREEEWRSSGSPAYRESEYYNEDEYARTHRSSTAAAGMGAAATGVVGSVTGAMGRAADRVGDALTPDPDRGTIYDDGMRGQEGGRVGEYQMAADMAGTRGRAATSDLGDEDTLKVVEERLNVGKRDVEGGRVRVRSYVREEPVSADVDLRSTRVTIERRPVDRAVGASDVDFQDRTLEAREHREEAVVAKEARVVEEIGLRQESDTRHETISDTVRRTEVEVEDERTGERIGGTGQAGSSASRSDESLMGRIEDRAPEEEDLRLRQDDIDRTRS